MTNTWKVLWAENEARRFKKFDGDSPKEAVTFGKSLRKQGLEVIGIISMKKAYAPPIGKEPDRAGWLWCPYCVKYQPFEFLSIHFMKVLLPPEYRCPVCTISINDYWVRKYNPVTASRFAHLSGVKDV